MKRNKKILLVEDEEDVIETTKFLLESEGYEVIVSKTGISALEEVYTNTPDLILLDIVIPQMDGFQVCRVLKNDEKYKNIPIIMLTAKTPKIDKFRGMESGADEYLTKPYDPSVLLKIIQKYLKPKL